MDDPRIHKLVNAILQAEQAGWTPWYSLEAYAKYLLKALDEPDTELVSVAFCMFDSPSKAAAYSGRSYTYEAAKSLKLTIGDKVYAPVDRGGFEHNELVTVVRLNAARPVQPVKRIAGRP